MSKDKNPVTAAVRALRAAGVSFTEHPYAYEEKGGTAVSARELGVDEHSVVKTLVMEDERKNPLIVLMHGDRQVSTKELARVMGVKTVAPCSPEAAQRHSGYLVGGTSPFGTRKSMPVYWRRRSWSCRRSTSTAGRGDSSWGSIPRKRPGCCKPDVWCKYATLFLVMTV